MPRVDSLWWNLFQATAWICLRDQVFTSQLGTESSVSQESMGGSGLSVLVAALVAKGAVPAVVVKVGYKGAIDKVDHPAMHQLSKAERELLNALAAGKIHVQGRRDGIGKFKTIPSVDWSLPLVMYFSHGGWAGPPPLAPSLGAIRWRELRFLRDDLLKLWPADVPVVHREGGIRERPFLPSAWFFP